MFKYIFVMAAVTYLIRMLPLTFFRKQIDNIYIKAFLKYIPYAVLSAMTIPDIFYSTGSIYSALAGLIIAIILSYLEKGLLTVSLAACAVVYVVEKIFM